MKIKMLLAAAMLFSLLFSPSAGLAASKEMTLKQVVDLGARYDASVRYVGSGGAHKPGEDRTFMLKGRNYRYFSKDLDTRKELLSYLKKTLTHTAAEHFIKDHGYIEYKGKMAQREADNPSLLMWNKATAHYVKTYKSTWHYRLVVPEQGSSKKEMYILEAQYSSVIGWRISTVPYLDSKK